MRNSKTSNNINALGVSVGQLDNDKELEIAYLSSNFMYDEIDNSLGSILNQSQLIVLNHDLTPLTGFPKYLETGISFNSKNRINSSTDRPIIDDINGDNINEILIGSLSRFDVYDNKAIHLPEYTKIITDSLFSEGFMNPELVDIDGDNQKDLILQVSGGRRLGSLENRMFDTNYFMAYNLPNFNQNINDRIAFENILIDDNNKWTSIYGNEFNTNNTFTRTQIVNDLKFGASVFFQNEKVLGGGILFIKWCIRIFSE